MPFMHISLLMFSFLCFFFYFSAQLSALCVCVFIKRRLVRCISKFVVLLGQKKLCRVCACSYMVWWLLCMRLRIAIVNWAFYVIQIWCFYFLLLHTHTHKMQPFHLPSCTDIYINILYRRFIMHFAFIIFHIVRFVFSLCKIYENKIHNKNMSGNGNGFQRCVMCVCVCAVPWQREISALPLTMNQRYKPLNEHINRGIDVLCCVVCWLPACLPACLLFGIWWVTEGGSSSCLS